MTADEAEDFFFVKRCFRLTPSLPVIAAHGYALGGGFELALACDINCGGHGSLAFPETGGYLRFRRPQAGALLPAERFTGRRIKAEEAEDKGVVNRVVPAADLMAEVKKVAESIAAKGPIAVRMAKEALWSGLDLDLDTGMEVEAELFAECFDSSDQKGAMQAFLNKEEFTDFQNK